MFDLKQLKPFFFQIKIANLLKEQLPRNLLFYWGRPRFPKILITSTRSFSNSNVTVPTEKEHDESSWDQLNFQKKWKKEKEIHLTAFYFVGVDRVLGQVSQSPCVRFLIQMQRCSLKKKKTKIKYFWNFLIFEVNGGHLQ